MNLPKRLIRNSDSSNCSTASVLCDRCMGEGGWWDNESIDQWYPCESCNGFGRVWKMSDLVERLRAYSDQLGGITDEAADEIERWKTIAKTLFKSKVLKMQGFSDPFTTVPTPEQAEARAIAKSESMTLDEVSKDLRASGVDVEAFLKRCQETIEGCYESALKKADLCEHRIFEDEDGQAICLECCKYFGWYCQISTKHFCEYEGDEECIHCGAPEERQ